MQAVPAPNEPQTKVAGEVVVELPKDLYIPPDALRIFLETFEGPLDLLLYLIRKQNIDILNIPIAEITRQYIRYIELMEAMKLGLVAEYLVMAATLAEIKSRMLLPRTETDEEGEEVDPRAELIRRLQEYERFKKAADNLNELPRLERDTHVANALAPAIEFKQAQPDVPMDDLLKAIQEVMERARLYTTHQIGREVLSVRERMTAVLDKVTADRYVKFTELFQAEEGRMGVVVTLSAILELIRQSMIELTQNEAFAPIYIKSKG